MRRVRAEPQDEKSRGLGTGPERHLLDSLACVSLRLFEVPARVAILNRLKAGKIES